MQYITVPYYYVLQSTVQYIMYRRVQYCTVQYITVMYCTVQDWSSSAGIVYKC